MREVNKKVEKHQFNLSGYLWCLNRSHRVYLEHYAKNLGITLGQYPYLVCLSYDDNITQDDLAELFQIDKCGVSRSLKKIEEKGLITRGIDPENRRKYILKLTEKGKKLTKYLKTKDDEWENLIYDNISISKNEFQKEFKTIFYKSMELNKELTKNNLKTCQESKK